MVKFREMIRLHEPGDNQSEIARSCLVARATGQDYLRRAAAKGLSYDQLAQMSKLHDAQHGDSSATDRLK